MTQTSKEDKGYGVSVTKSVNETWQTITVTAERTDGTTEHYQVIAKNTKK